ncbi:hypothetical protein BC826DRAFT_1042333 [Russula brevipes]|nr:hypothetical protein BC826DRAFT_1042333 [Russula brevipes]
MQLCTPWVCSVYFLGCRVEAIWGGGVCSHFTRSRPAGGVYSLCWGSVGGCVMRVEFGPLRSRERRMFTRYYTGVIS